MKFISGVGYYLNSDDKGLLIESLEDFIVGEMLHIAIDLDYFNLNSKSKCFYPQDNKDISYSLFGGDSRGLDLLESLNSLLRCKEVFKLHKFIVNSSSMNGPTHTALEDSLFMSLRYNKLKRYKL